MLEGFKQARKLVATFDHLSLSPFKPGDNRFDPP